MLSGGANGKAGIILEILAKVCSKYARCCIFAVNHWPRFFSICWSNDGKRAFVSAPSKTFVTVNA